ncbi:FAD-dependent oxidoreductase [Rhodohalobacter sp. 614A]|uniref:FAD-dependent oxidoreductase n=1 Tax=Rhodohalobacter sp. 614A TaxID=2908649 RepID=UPI001F31BD89|nr:FAD-dependent monooxygenase [Rhodohalobacter sp. 614A]
METDIVIVGGGPVGLFLAGRLIQHGISCKVLEKRNKIDRHSKSLGIHPVSMELFHTAGIVKPFLKEGLKIKKGIAFWDAKELGTISFEDCPPPFRFILALPQWKTERILENWVRKSDPDAFIRGSEVTGISQTHDSTEIKFTHNRDTKSIRSRFLVGCDGKNSIVRKLAGIEFIGKAYPDCYIMGDFEDTTPFGSDAAVYLHSEGLIESFPLPNDQRRWVLKTDRYIENPTPQMIAEIVRTRIHHILYGAKNFMVSSFGVQQYSAEKYVHQNVLLAGDAAHVVSPIGGQGMNLGWLDAEHVTSVLKNTLEDSSNQKRLFSEYSKNRKKIARQVAKRAEMNMHLGRKETSTFFYKMMMTISLKSRLNKLLAQIFTMRGLGKWWI